MRGDSHYPDTRAHFFHAEYFTTMCLAFIIVVHSRGYHNTSLPLGGL